MSDAMGWVTEIPVRILLNNGALSPDQGGYAALVVVVSRAEGDGSLHQQHLNDWPSIHSVTGRHLAVITPDPEWSLAVDHGVVVRGLKLFGPECELPGVRPWSLAAAYAPGLPRSIGEHAAAVTTIATELQEYFGLAEDALPCALIVCTKQQQVIAIGLSSKITLYEVLKRMKSALEPQLARLNRATAEVNASNREKLRAESEYDAAAHRASTWRRAVAECKDRAERRAWVGKKLTDLAGDVEADIATLCRWFAARITDDRALDHRDTKRAEALLAALHGRIGRLSRGQLRSLRRELPRVVATLGTHSAQLPQEPDDDLAGLAECAARSQAAYDDALSSLHSAACDLDMPGAVRSAADTFGLEESPSVLLPWRETRWPVTAFMPPPHRSPAVRRDRG
ncbi:hypothetical protein [Nonomuraea sp. NPDC023979]|uniref:hypothetical protein n=1 Tax=Nonomuraea sp. NPDC023979 TaxID=3154796 RepID=UPI0033D43DB0